MRALPRLPWHPIPAIAFAVATTVATLAVRLEWGVAFGPRPLLILFVLPIMLSAFLGGFTGGVVSTLTAALLVDWFLIPPTGSLAIAAGHDLAQMTMFVVDGVLISVLTEALHRSRRRAEARQEEIGRLNAGLETRVQQRTAELLAANQEMESFAYAVAHDLRAPLRAMSGFSHALVEDFGSGLEEGARGHIDQVMLASRHMGELIDGLLTLSRVSRGELQHEPVDISALAERVRVELTQAEPHRNVTWSIDAAMSARGDPRMIEAAVHNLIDNAWKYTARKDDAEISVRGERRNGVSRFIVADDGAGFDMRHAGLLFKPFQRLHRQDEFPGLGIGLATVQRIVLRHGGSIEVEAAPGQGARFSFSLSPDDIASREDA
jgi:K+-sensing histidine kinase KdpD